MEVVGEVIRHGAGNTATDELHIVGAVSEQCRDLFELLIIELCEGLVDVLDDLVRELIDDVIRLGCRGCLL
jgi:hypothetical protein